MIIGRAPAIAGGVFTPVHGNFCRAPHLTSFSSCALIRDCSRLAPYNAHAGRSTAVCHRRAFRWQAKRAKVPPTHQIELFIVLVVTSVNLLSYTTLQPITPGLVDHFELGAHVKLGFVASSFTLGRLCTTSLWPVASDYFGRRLVLCIALFGGALGATLQGFAIACSWPFTAFLLVRGLTGMFSGIVPIVKAYMADTFPGDELPKVLAYREAAGTFAFIVGPTVGGVLASWWFPTPLFFSALCGLFAVGLVTCTLYDRSPTQASARPKTSTSRTMRSFTSTSIALMVLSFIWAGTRTCFHTYYPLVLGKTYNLSPANLGKFLTVSSLIVAIIQIRGFDPCRRRFGLLRTLGFGGVLVSVGLAALGLHSKGISWNMFLLATAMYLVGVALFSPALPALLLQSAPPDRCGTLLGVESVLVNFSRIIAPPLFGIFYHRGALPACAAIMGFTTTTVWILAAKLRGTSGS